MQRDHGAINVSLRVRPEVEGEPAILFVVGSVKPVVMEVAHWKLEFVKTELQRVTFEPDFENAVGGILIVGDIIGQRVGWLGVWNAVGPGFRARFRACFLAGESPRELALAPWCLIHAEKPFVHVVTDDVVQRGAVVTDHQDAYADLVVRPEGNLKMDTGKVATVKSHQMSAIGRGLPPHSISRIE